VRINYGEFVMNTSNGTSIFSKPRILWVQHREASLNWLALGLLLAAWNAADNDDAVNAPRRPDSLRAYAYVSVRAAQRSQATAPTSFVVQANDVQGRALAPN
jgi:hypothetical protein